MGPNKEGNDYPYTELVKNLNSSAGRFAAAAANIKKSVWQPQLKLNKRTVAEEAQGNGGAIHRATGPNTKLSGHDIKVATIKPQQQLRFNLGKSHKSVYKIPLQYVTISNNILKSTGILSISSISLLKLTEVVSEIKRYRKVEPYKGKGILLEGEKFISKSTNTK